MNESPGKIGKMKPTKHQQEKIDQVVDWYENGTGPFWLAGKAGTGKSECLKFVIEQLGLKETEYIICAPSNKAVGVLMSKGFEHAQTVAKVARTSKIAGPGKKRFGELSNQLDFARKKNNHQTTKVILQELSELRLSGEVYWEQTQRITTKVKLIIVDEASMLSNRDAASLAATKSPVLLVGDKNQLLSVNTTGSKEDESSINGKKPHAELTEIIRQSGDGSIVGAAQSILDDANYKFLDLVPGETKLDEETGESITKLTDIKPDIDQYLAYTNNQCFRHINEVRKDKGAIPEVGDRLLSYSNDGDIVKSQIYKVIQCFDEKNGLLSLYLEDETGVIKETIHTYCQKSLFNKSHSNKTRLALLGQSAKKNAPGVTEINSFYYADCITVHKSQGGQWNSVGFYLPQTGYYNNIPYDTLRRIKYTAVTRAKKELYILE